MNKRLELDTLDVVKIVSENGCSYIETVNMILDNDVRTQNFSINQNTYQATDTDDNSNYQVEMVWRRTKLNYIMVYPVENMNEKLKLKEMKSDLLDQICYEYGMDDLYPYEDIDKIHERFTKFLEEKDELRFKQMFKSKEEKGE